MRIHGIIFISLCTFLFWAANGSDTGEHDYVGVARCRKCHKKEKRGNQYGKWLEAPHSRAYKNLASDSAKAVAARVGLKEDPQKSKECLICHVTAFGVEASRFDSAFRMEDGIQCEACHGPGKDYKKKTIMKDHDKAVANGLIIPDENVCKNCHNQDSPTYREFFFEERWKKIAHPFPEDYKGSGK